MNKIILAVCLFISAQCHSQIDEAMGNQYYKRIFEYDYVERKPVFPYRADSLRIFYLSHYTGVDSLIARCVANGDTAKYIRVKFEFIIDENGNAYDAKFLKVATTRYKSSSGDKVVKYFDDMKTEFNDAIKQMIKAMPTWRPALQNNVRVSCRKEDFFQFWLGINPPNE